MTNEEAKAYFEMRLSDTVRYANGKQTRQREAFELALMALRKVVTMEQYIDVRFLESSYIEAYNEGYSEGFKAGRQ